MAYILQLSESTPTIWIKDISTVPGLLKCQLVAASRSSFRFCEGSSAISKFSVTNMQQQYGRSGGVQHRSDAQHLSMLPASHPGNHTTTTRHPPIASRSLRNQASTPQSTNPTRRRVCDIGETLGVLDDLYVRPHRLLVIVQCGHLAAFYPWRDCTVYLHQGSNFHPRFLSFL